MKKFECDEVERLSALYVGGDVTAEERRGVERHFVVCDSCRRAYDEMLSAYAALTSFAERPLPVDGALSLRERLDAELGPPAATRPQRVEPLIKTSHLAAAASLLFAIALYRDWPFNRSFDEGNQRIVGTIDPTVRRNNAGGSIRTGGTMVSEPSGRPSPKGSLVVQGPTIDHARTEAVFRGLSLREEVQCESMTSRRRRLRVTCVDPESAAARSGVRPGDWIVSINGAVVTDVANLESIRRTVAAAGESLKIELERGEECDCVKMVVSSNDGGPTTRIGNYKSNRPMSYDAVGPGAESPNRTNGSILPKNQPNKPGEPPTQSPNPKPTDAPDDDKKGVIELKPDQDSIRPERRPTDCARATFQRFETTPIRPKLSDSAGRRVVRRTIELDSANAESAIFVWAARRVRCRPAPAIPTKSGGPVSTEPETKIQRSFWSGRS
jgi:hypothetical protein